MDKISFIIELSDLLKKYNIELEVISNSITVAGENLGNRVDFESLETLIYVEDKDLKKL